MFQVQSKYVLLGLMVLILTVTSAQAQGQTIRVSSNGNDSNGCGEAAAPCQSLQMAVEQIPLGGTGTILIAAGTYRYADTGVEKTGREVMRVVARTLTVKGGYANGDWDTANPSTNVTIIDGQASRRAMTVESANGVRATLMLEGVILTNGKAPTETGTGFSFGGAFLAYDSTVTLSKVTVTNSTAKGEDRTAAVPGAGGGGGLAFLQGTIATLRQVILTDNMAQGGLGTAGAYRGGLGVGGAVYVLESTVSIDGLTASQNKAVAGDATAALGLDEGQQRADGLGGALCFIRSTVTAINNVTLSNNTAQGGKTANLGGLGLGGGLFLELTKGTATMKNITLSNNLAVGGDGITGGAGLGGGLFSTDSIVVMDSATFDNNQVKGATGTTQGGDAGGGGMYFTLVDATFNSSLNGTNITGTNNKVIGGSGATHGRAFGGAIQLNSDITKGTTATISNATLSQNKIENGDFSSGGGMYVSANTTLHLNNSTIANNIVQGGVSPNGSGQGGGLIVANSTATIKQSSIYNNQALGGTGSVAGGGLGRGGGLFIDNSNVTVDGLVVLNNVAQGGSVAGKGSDTTGGGIQVEGNQPFKATNLIVGSNNAKATKSGNFAFGGGIFIQQPTQVNLTHATIANNSVSGATNNQGVGIFTVKGSSLTAKYSIIANHTGGDAAVRTVGTANFDFTLWDSNSKDWFDENGSQNLQGTHAVSGSPDFVDVSSTPANFHLQATSAARNQATGSNTATDIDGEARPNPIDGGPDLGADEYYSNFKLTVTVIDATSLKLTWQAASGAANYKIEYTPAGTEPSPITVSGGVAARAYTLAGLTTGQAYNITVVGYDANGTELERTNSVQITPVELVKIYLPVVVQF